MSDEPRVADDGFDDLLGAYALDALDEAEMQAMDAYLAENARARAEVDELRETAAMLALTANERDRAPASLWQRIEAETLGTRSTTDDATAPVVPLAPRRSARRSAWLAAAAALILVVAIAGGVLVADDDAPDMAEKYLAAAKTGQEFHLMSPDTGTEMAGVALERDGTGYFRGEGLHELEAGQVYQLWVMPDDSAPPVSVGIISDPNEVVSINVPGRFSKIALSMEDAPGAASPTTPVAAAAT